MHHTSAIGPVARRLRLGRVQRTSQGARLTAQASVLSLILACAQPLRADVITFDNVPDGTPINNFYPGVTLTEVGSGRPIYARNADPSARSSPNVVSVNQTGMAPFYNYYGAVQATFAVPQSTVSIDAAAFRLPESLGTPLNRPTLQAYDASNRLLGSVSFQGPLPVNGSTPYETLRFTAPAATITRVVFGIAGNSGPVVYGFFDNLAFGSSTTLPLRFDDFEPTKWRRSADGSGVAVQQRNGKLEMVVDKAAAGALFAGRYDSKCLLHGDFDITVGYNLPAPQANSGVRLGLVLPGAGHIERNSMSTHDVMSPGEYYLSSIGGAGSPWTPTSQASSTLRVTRTGSLMSMYAYNTAQAGWQALQSGTTTTADLPMQLQVWSHDAVFDKRAVTVQFDDVVLNKGRLVGPLCPTPTP